MRGFTVPEPDPRTPAGTPGNFSGTPVAPQTMSSRTSASTRRRSPASCSARRLGWSRSGASSVDRSPSRRSRGSSRERRTDSRQESSPRSRAVRDSREDSYLGSHRPVRPIRGRGSGPNNDWPGCAEVRVFGRNEPIGQRLRGSSPLATDDGPAPKGRGKTFRPVRGFVATASPCANTRLASRAGCDDERGEERLHAVIVVLGPLVVRVVMAFCARDSDAEKHLRNEPAASPG